MVLTVSFVLSLGTGLSCSHRKQVVLLTWHQRRDARTTRLRRPHQDQSSAQRLRADTAASIASRLTFRDDSAYAPHAEVGWLQNASDLGSASSLFLKIGMYSLRHIGTTGSFRMARMRRS